MTSDRYWSWEFDSTNVSPYAGSYYFGIQGGYIYVDNNDSTPSSGGYDDRYRIRVLKEETHEPGSFVDGNAAGVLQRIGTKARWGYASFDGDDGAHIRYPVGSDTADIATYLQTESMNSWTPLAESLYVTLQYFKQEAVASGLGIDTNASGTLNDVWDPYNADGEVESVTYQPISSSQGIETSCDASTNSRSGNNDSFLHTPGNVSRKEMGLILHSPQMICLKDYHNV